MIGSMLRKAQLSGGCAATAAPPVPDSLDLSIPGLILPTEVEMSWNSGSGPGDAATSYVLEASDDNFTTVAATVTASSTSATLTGLTENVYYDFRVKAVNCFGESAYHDAALGQYTPLKTPTGPGTAAGLGATVAGTTITLDWDDESSAESGYQIERSTDGVSYSLIHTTAANVQTYADTGLAAGTYYYRVRAYDSGTNNWSSWLVQTGSSTVAGLSPSWTLDFSSGTPSGYTLTRASSGSYVDSSGYIASAATDVARLTHNSSGSRLGLLVEGQRVNSAQYSETFTNAYWGKIGTTIDDNGGSFWTSPANASDAVLLKQDTTTASHRLQRVENSQTNSCWSLFVKKQNLTTGSGRAGRYLTLLLRDGANSANYYHATFDLDLGTMTQAANVGSTYSSTNSGIEPYKDDWYRVWVTGTRSSGQTAYYATLATTGTPTMTSTGESYTGANSTDGVYIWGAQIETVVGPPTSYIETPSNASVTRSADLVHVLDSSITSWGDPGALVVHFYPPGQAGTLISTDNASTAQIGIEAQTSATTIRGMWSSGQTATSNTSGTGVQKAVHYWNGTNSRFCLNGGTVQTGTNNLTIANTDFVTLGAEATDSSGVPGTFSQYSNFVIRKLEWFSGTLTDANLQTVTT